MADAVLRSERALLPLSRGGPRGPAGDRSADRARASSSCSPAAPASGKSTLLRAGCGLVPHFHGGRDRGRARGRRDGRPLARPRGAGRGGRAGRPGAGDSGRQHHGPGRDRAAARASRGFTPAARSRAVEEVALALAIDGLLERTTDTLSGGELQRVALAAALATPAAARPARRADLSARPGGRRRADLPAPAPERGVGGGRAARGASAGALPGGRGPSDRPGGRGASPSTAPRETSSTGPWSHDRVLTTPGARLLRRGRAPGPCERPRGPADARRARRAIARGRLGAATPRRPRASIARRAEDSLALGFRDVWVELGAGEERTEAAAGA